MLTRFFTFETHTGRVVLRGSAPADRVPAEVPAGHGMVVVLDGIIPVAGFRVDRRRVAKAGVSVVPTMDGIALPPDKTQGVTPEVALTTALDRAVRLLDADYAARLEVVVGPFSAVHAEKRRQAETGGGPLVRDEADRLAILAKAAAQDKAVAALELQRRDLKARLRAATTEGEIKAIIAGI